MIGTAVAPDFRSRIRNLAGLIAVLAAILLSACELSVGSERIAGDPSRQDPVLEPAIEQPAFGFGEFVHRNLAGGDGLIEVELGIEITNSGGTGSAELEMGIEGQDIAPVSKVEGLPAGSSTTVTLVRQLAPGSHQVTMAIGAARQTRELTITSPDLRVTMASAPEIGADHVGFEALVENAGDAPAEGLTFTASWTPLAGEGRSDQIEIPLGIEPLEPGTVRDIPFVGGIAVGSYQLVINVDSETVEADRSNNRLEFEFSVDYVGIQMNVESVSVGDWTQEGDGVATIGVELTNVGLTPIEPTILGAKCLSDAGTECDLRRDLPAIPVGSVHAETLTLNLPQGTHRLRVYAGADEDTYRWGQGNAFDLEVVVPAQPDTWLIGESDWRIAGHYSSGHAAIELDYSIRNAGSEPARDPIAVTITCLREGLVVPDCGAEFPAQLPDGFGPHQFRWELSVPTGVDLGTALSGKAQDEARFPVPARIVGVERHVWDCYSERPEIGQFGCSGWSIPVVGKWPPGEPISYWVTGDSAYIDLFEEFVANFSEWFGLDFEPAQSRESAQLLAFMGIVEGEPGIDPVPCPRRSSCGSYRFDGGAITWAAIEIPHAGDLSETNVRNSIEKRLWGRLLGAATRFEQRPTLDASLGEKPGVSPLEFAMVRLNSHPLLEPDMEISEVLELIVFADQTLDPMSPSDFGVAFVAIHNAVRELTRASSARYSLINQVSGLCFTGNYGPAVYEIGDLNDEITAIGAFDRPDLVRFIWGQHDYVIYRDRHPFRRAGDRWHSIEPVDVRVATGWWEDHSGLFFVLERTLKITDPGALTVDFGPDGRLNIRTTEVVDIGTRQMTVSIDPETNRIVRFSDHVNIYDTCQATSEANLVDYGVDLIDSAVFFRML